MAPRPKRSNPQPPDRGRVRSPGKITYEPLKRSPAAKGTTAYEKTLLRGAGAPPPPPPPAPPAPPSPSNPTPGPSGNAARAASNRKMSYSTAMAWQLAKDGDDSALLPYQPTPSINPPRPRTLAAGYDSDADTLRIKFRDGAIYEYYGVSTREWNNFKRVKSPGKYINRTLNAKIYDRVWN